VQVERAGLAVRPHGLGGEGVQVGLVAGRDLQGGGLDLHEALGLQNQARIAALIRPRASQERPAVGVDVGAPPGGLLMGGHTLGRPLRRRNAGDFADPRYTAQPNPREFAREERTNLKVAASSLRKGAVVDMDGKLYVVLTVDNIHPGKGTPVTQLNMRRISDGVKVSERYRTTEQVERAIVDDRNHTFLYRTATASTS
jgi:hypothetical protein